MLEVETFYANDVAKAQNFPANDDFLSFYNYTGNGKGHSSRFLYGETIGGEFVLHPQLALQLGASYYQSASFDVSGFVTQGIDIPSSDTYSYQYHIQSRQVLAESKLLYKWKRFHPYVAGGIGAAFNKAQNFSVDIQPVFTAFSNQFADGSSITLSYSLGAGIDIDIFKYVRFGVGYRFADFGTAKTNPAYIDNVATPNQLSSAHLYVNEVLAQLSLVL